MNAARNCQFESGQKPRLDIEPTIWYRRLICDFSTEPVLSEVEVLLLTHSMND